MNTKEQALLAMKKSRDIETRLLEMEGEIQGLIVRSTQVDPTLLSIFLRRDVFKNLERNLKTTGVSLGSVAASRRELERRYPEFEIGLFEIDDEGTIINVLETITDSAEGEDNPELRILPKLDEESG